MLTDIETVTEQLLQWVDSIGPCILDHDPKYDLKYAWVELLCSPSWNGCELQSRIRQTYTITPTNKELKRSGFISYYSVQGSNFTGPCINLNAMNQLFDLGYSKKELVFIKLNDYNLYNGKRLYDNPAGDLLLRLLTASSYVPLLAFKEIRTWESLIQYLEKHRT